uniref:Uncharacterized protein n=1 Tax=Arundo donax TaxID=35708 RepID=A0A0A8XYU3_ARUDO
MASPYKMSIWLLSQKTKSGINHGNNSTTNYFLHRTPPINWSKMLSPSHEL